MLIWEAMASGRNIRRRWQKDCNKKLRTTTKISQGASAKEYMLEQGIEIFSSIINGKLIKKK